jgi:hypothetical protein
MAILHFGVYFYEGNNNVSISDSDISHNAAGYNGGGINSNYDNDYVSISNSTVSYNTAGDNGGGLVTRATAIVDIRFQISPTMLQAVMEEASILTPDNDHRSTTDGVLQHSCCDYHGGGLYFYENNSYSSISDSAR